MFLSLGVEVFLYLLQSLGSFGDRDIYLFVITASFTCQEKSSIKQSRNEVRLPPNNYFFHSMLCHDAVEMSFHLPQQVALPLIKMFKNTRQCCD